MVGAHILSIEDGLSSLGLGTVVGAEDILSMEDVDQEGILGTVVGSYNLSIEVGLRILGTVVGLGILLCNLLE